MPATSFSTTVTLKPVADVHWNCESDVLNIWRVVHVWLPRSNESSPIVTVTFCVSFHWCGHTSSCVGCQVAPSRSTATKIDTRSRGLDCKLMEYVKLPPSSTVGPKPLSDTSDESSSSTIACTCPIIPLYLASALLTMCSTTNE